MASMEGGGFVGSSSEGGSRSTTGPRWAGWGTNCFNRSKLNQGWMPRSQYSAGSWSWQVLLRVANTGKGPMYCGLNLGGCRSLRFTVERKTRSPTSNSATEVLCSLSRFRYNCSWAL
eukprot:3847759-Rhodomonas_salina.1